MPKYGKEDFLKECLELYEDLNYDYSKVDYKHKKYPIIIICPKHGQFTKRPLRHLNGEICTTCSRESRRYSTEQYVEKCNKVHNDKYDYSKTVYTKAHDKIIVICPYHGEFKPHAYSHIAGKGCKKCATPVKYNTEQYIEKCQKVHKNRYSYTNTIYVKYDEKVKIICHIHGEFEQVASSHLGGRGCRDCAGYIERDTKTNDRFFKQFLEKAKASHGEIYDYSLVDYINADTKIKVICSSHGEFEITPRNHTKGSGCRDCYYEKKVCKPRSNTEEFIKKAVVIHGENYDYSLSEYIKYYENIIIICKKHGKFEQTPASHLSGRGCKDCGIETLTKLFSMSTEDFIEKSKNRFGTIFDYSLTEYINKQTKVKIICSTHGVFEQYPWSHLTCLHGCQKCSKTHRYSTEEYIEKVKEKHGEKYDYSLTKYVRGKDDIMIICPEHGEFKQNASHHMQGVGCPDCNESKGEKKVARILDKYNIKYERQKKFDKCKNIYHLPFDFYIEDYNLIIEYDGKQHFKAVKFFGGEEGYKKRQINDEIKNKFCSDNYINLLRIKYNEDVEQSIRCWFDYLIEDI